MKTKSIKYMIAAGLVCCGFSATMTSCSDVLDEQPRSNLDPTFFTEKKGLEGGLTSLYAHLRYFYGNGYYLNACETGTDEYTYAQSADGNMKDADLSGVGQMVSTNSIAGGMWGTAFANINTCNGIIENGEGQVDASLLAEAHFFRAFDYFHLVQWYGGVPLDLGSGVLKFNTSTVRTSTRNTVPEVYKAIFDDLELAVKDLSDNPRLTGAVTKNVARLYLSKAYLTFAWWLDSSIPTYPECERKDLNGKTSAQYFQAAYDLAMEAINAPGPYGLMETFYDVNVATNDRNKECMLYADHDENEKYGNGGVGYGWGSGGSPENFAYWFETWNYTEMIAKDPDGNNINPVQREAVQGLGRPWTRMAPIADNFMKKDLSKGISRDGVWCDDVKSIDSRYDATFTLSYFTNWHKAGGTAEYVMGANGMHVGKDEIYFTWVPESDDANINYTGADGKLGFGEMAGRADFVVAVNHISRKKYPCNWKIGIYRTDNNGGLGSKVNGGSPRPWTIAKFSEFYLIAAEAAVKGATGSKSARDLVNVLRERAGKMTYCVNQRSNFSADHSAEMVAATPATIDIDYILDERSREFWGEGYRWFDLVRTQKWAERSKVYHIAGSDYTDKDLGEVQREIPDGYYLRPIPQDQIDGMEMDDAAKQAYQNPAYRN